MSDILYRQAEMNDLAALTGLLCELYENHPYEKLYAENTAHISDGRHVFFLAFEAGHAIGVCHGALRSEYVNGKKDAGTAGYLEAVYVRPEYRLRGIACTLVAMCEEWASQNGCREFLSDCLLDNESSYQFHRKIGFTETERCIFFRKELPLPAVKRNYMRIEREITDMILDAAKKDERIRAVLLVGSRANPAVPKDRFQDYDVTFFVTDIAPFYNNPAWTEEHFGKPLIMQMPEAMRYPDGDGHFCYLMLYPDGVRIDLSFEYTKYIDDGEPAVVLLDKDSGNGFLPALPPPGDRHWHIEPPSLLFFHSCCNNFWWCLNNVAKGIARDELPYVMHMLNDIVRAELHDMIRWYIGVQHGFSLSAGKDGKYFKRYLPPELYAQYAATYSGSGYAGIWKSVDVMCDLFHTLATAVAGHFTFPYHQDEENGMREYLRMVKEQVI